VSTIYFDHNATTPIDPAVRESMLPFLDTVFGNPSSVHQVGRKARALLDDAHDRVAAVLRCRPSEVLFTGGGTEANNLAILGTARAARSRGNHLLTSPTEHPAVLRTFQYLAERESFELSYLPVDSFGRVDPDEVKRSIRPETVLVSVMSANNETGTAQEVAAIAAICRERGVLFHTDSVQSFGKQPLESLLQVGADLMTICPHKFYGPKGVGALFVRSPLRLDPIHHGGPQEGDRRPGTENLMAIHGLVVAMERGLQPPVFDADHLRPLTERLVEELLRTEGVRLVSPERRLPNTVAFVVSGCDSLSLLAALDLEGICASSGSACSAGSVEPSRVLLAQGYDRSLASSFLRFSLGRDSTAEEVSILAGVFGPVVSRIREVR